MAIKLLKAADLISLIDALNERFKAIASSGGTVIAGSGISAEDNKVSVDNGEYLKFEDNKLTVDRDALDIPDEFHLAAGDGIMVQDNQVGVDKGNYLQFVDGRLEVDTVALAKELAGDGLAVSDGKLVVKTTAVA